MEPIMTVGWILIVIVLLGCSAFFSSAEIAVFSLSESWIDSQATTGSKNAVILTDLFTDPHRLLVTVLVGNNLVNIAIASIITVLLVTYLPASYVVIVSTIVTSTVVLMFGEIIPKSYGLANAERWALIVAPMIHRIEKVLYPIIIVLDTVTRYFSKVLNTETNIEQPYLD